MGRTWFETRGVSNGSTETINPIIEKVRQLAHEFKDSDRLQILVAATDHARIAAA